MFRYPCVFKCWDSRFLSWSPNTNPLRTSLIIPKQTLLTAFQKYLHQQCSWPGFQPKDQVQGQLTSLKSQPLFFWLLNFQCPSLVWDGREKQLGVAESSMSYEVNSPFRGRYSPWQNGQVGTTCSFNLSLIFLLLPGAQVVLPLADCLPTQ